MASAHPKIMPVASNDPIVENWPQILRTIRERNTLPNISMIGCYRYGDKLRTTIVILINVPRCPPELIKRNEGNLRSLLDREKLQHVGILIERGAIEPGGASELQGASSTGIVDFEVFENPALIGQSTAATYNKISSGTLGGFLRIRREGSSNWKTVAITCWHVLLPQGEDEYSNKLIDHWLKHAMNPQINLNPELVIQEWHKKGVKPTDRYRKLLQVDHPSTDTMNETHELLDEELQERNTPHFRLLKQQVEEEYTELFRNKDWDVFQKGKETLERSNSLQKFMANVGTEFGTLWAASGNKITHEYGPTGNKKLPCALDWCLIEPFENRIPKVFNPHPSQATFPKFHDIPSHPARLRDLRGAEVCCYGQRSGYRVGFVHSLETVHNYPELSDELLDQLGSTQEWVVSGYSTRTSDGKVQWSPFTMKGDSGSLVYTNDDPDNRTVVGMVRAGDSERARWTFVTPIEFIYADIKSVTGAAEVRLMV